jgi:hypothetical protein
MPKLPTYPHFDDDKVVPVEDDPTALLDAHNRKNATMRAMSALSMPPQISSTPASPASSQVVAASMEPPGVAEVFQHGSDASKSSPHTTLAVDDASSIGHDAYGSPQTDSDALSASDTDVESTQDEVDSDEGGSQELLSYSTLTLS